MGSSVFTGAKEPYHRGIVSGDRVKKSPRRGFVGHNGRQPRPGAARACRFVNWRYCRRCALFALPRRVSPLSEKETTDEERDVSRKQVIFITTSSPKRHVLTSTAVAPHLMARNSPHGVDYVFIYSVNFATWSFPGPVSLLSSSGRVERDVTKPNFA